MLDVEIKPFADKLNFDRRAAYRKAVDTKTITTHSEDNPITRGYSPMPWAPAFNALQQAMKPLLGHAAPAVPLAAWQDHALFKKAWAHLFINSAYPWRLLRGNDWAQAGPTVIAGFLYEYYVVQDYRRALLKGPGGELRHILLEALPQELTAAITYEYEDGTTSIVWWDAFRFPRVKRESDEIYRKRSEVAILDKSLSDEVAKMVKMLGKSSIAILPTSRYSDDDPSYVAREVDDAAKNLVKVRLHRSPKSI